MVMLLLLKKLGDRKREGFMNKLCWFISLSRNAVVVVVGMVITYTLKVKMDAEPLNIIGEIGSGLPEFSVPPFSSIVGNETYTFADMVKVLGAQSLAIPFVSILESVAIAKAFAEGATVDATQEMIALGLCNLLGSFGQSMPITGSFTRTALNHVSGVKTPAGGVTKVLLLTVALTSLTSTFYYIPKASLAGLIMVAMFSMIDYEIFVRLWQNSKRELVVLVTTLIVCLSMGLEYGITAGIAVEAAVLLYYVARPTVEVRVSKSENSAVVVIPLSNRVSYCAGEHVRRTVLNAAPSSEAIVIINGTDLRNMDFTVAFNLMAVAKELQRRSQKIILMNFDAHLKRLCVDVNPKCESLFVNASSHVDLTKEIVGVV